MRTVIGEYESLAAAEQAVRALESQMPILNVVIGARPEPKSRRRGDAHREHIVVSMTGTPELIERGRQLLRFQA